MEEFFKEISELEEKLWGRRMKVLSQYRRLMETKEKIRKLEKKLEEELGIDIETIYKFVEEYEKNVENIHILKEVYNQELLDLLETFIYKIKEVKSMKEEVEHIEKEILSMDKDIDRVFEKLEEYKRRLQEGR